MYTKGVKKVGYTFIFLFSFIVGTFLFFQSTTYGETTHTFGLEDIADGLVPCGKDIKVVVDNVNNQVCYTGECNLCHVQKMAMNGVIFIIAMAIVFCGLVLVYAGLLLVFFAFVPNALSRARSIVWHSIVGFIGLLAAFLIVDTVMRALFADENIEFGPWNEYLCKGAGGDGDSVVQCFKIIEPLQLHAESYPLHVAGPGYDDTDLVFDSELGIKVLSMESLTKGRSNLNNAGICGVGTLSCAEMIIQESLAQGVDPRFGIAIASIESAGRPDVVFGRKTSSAGAIGLMQLMPATARDMCGDRCKGMSESQLKSFLSNPQNNAELGVKYLKTMYNDKRIVDLSGGNVEKRILYASMAYNAGPNQGRLSPKEGCVGGITSGCFSETAAYVGKISNLLGISF